MSIQLGFEQLESELKDAWANKRRRENELMESVKSSFDRIRSHFERLAHVIGAASGIPVEFKYDQEPVMDADQTRITAKFLLIGAGISMPFERRVIFSRGGFTQLPENRYSPDLLDQGLSNITLTAMTHFRPKVGTD